MEERGWDCCDFVFVCGDAYVDHPSFGMAIITRLLEANHYKVGVICNPIGATRKASRCWEGLGWDSWFPLAIWTRW